MTGDPTTSGPIPSMLPVLVLTTVATREEAERIALLLVEERLAACVNLIPGLRSIYRWQGAIESAPEVLLLIKSSSDLLPELERTITAHHSYQVPEFMVVDIQAGSELYLRWIRENLR